jgi:hypothetical protein
MKTQIKKVIIACLTFITFLSQAQTGSPSTEIARVSFSIRNPSLKSKLVDFKSYSAEKERFTAGYGYGLNGLATHAVNLPVPVYVFQEKNGKKELLFVVTEKDNGKAFNVNEEYEISREQYLEAARAEMNQRNYDKAKEDNSMESIAKKKGLKLVNVNFKGSSWLPSMAHIRYELPWGKDNQLGFSGSLSKFNGRDLTLPIGTKIYQCSDKYWSKDTKFTEKLILTVENDKSEMKIILN